MSAERTLAQRLGVTTHVSPLRMKLRRLQQLYPSEGAASLEDWLLDVANARGVTVVAREWQRIRPGAWQAPPPPEALSNAELVTGICQPHNRDRPQWLRAAAQLVSRRDADLDELVLLASRERVGRILAAVARQALKAAPTHPMWKRLAGLDRKEPPLRDSLIHWTRLAEPVMRPGRPGAERWRLVG